MKIITSLVFLMFSRLLLVGQVFNYHITTNPCLISPINIYNSNEENLLILNGEINWDEGYYNLLKVKPNGDTIYIKKIDAPILSVTSSGNFFTNYTYLLDVAPGSWASHLSLHDKYAQKKWRIDLTNSFTPGPSDFAIPPTVNDIIEINTNKYLLSANTYTTNMGTSYVPNNIFAEIDSLGNITNSFLNGYSDKFIGKINNNIYCFRQALPQNGYYGAITKYNYITHSYDYVYNHGFQPNLKIHKGILTESNKIILVGSLLNSSYYKGVISCFDTLGNNLWSKIISTSDTNSHQISDIKQVSNNLFLCKYDSHLLSFDSIGNLLYEYSNFNTGYTPSDIAVLNKSAYLTGSDSANYIKLVKTDSVGYNYCSSNITFSLIPLLFSNTSMGFSILGTANFTPTALSPNNSSSSYTLTQTSTCDIQTKLTQNHFNSFEIKIYPNPVSDKFRIDSENIDFDEIRLFSIYGSFLKSFTNNKKEFDISEFSNGIYTFELLKKSKTLYKQKLIVSK